jgi:hypothetical protein
MVAAGLNTLVVAAGKTTELHSIIKMGLIRIN